MEKALYVLTISHEERRKRRKGESYHTCRFYHMVMPQASNKCRRGPYCNNVGSNQWCSTLCIAVSTFLTIYIGRRLLI
jgi:hypothetical protein